MERRWADVSFVTEEAKAAGVKLLSFVWPADSEADKANLISAPESRANAARRPRRVTYRTNIKSSFSV